MRHTGWWNFVYAPGYGFADPTGWCHSPAAPAGNPIPWRVMADQPKIVVYRTAHCPFCIAAHDLLEARGLDFEEVALDQEPDRRAFTSSILPGHNTVPLVVIGDKPIGGFQELRAMEASGGLISLKGS